MMGGKYSLHENYPDFTEIVTKGYKEFKGNYLYGTVTEQGLEGYGVSLNLIHDQLYFLNYGFFVNGTLTVGNLIELDEDQVKVLEKNRFNETHVFQGHFEDATENMSFAVKSSYRVRT